MPNNGKLTFAPALALSVFVTDFAESVAILFGIIKEVLGLRRFHLRGLVKVETEWHLACLCYNFKRLFNLIGNDSGTTIA